MPIEPTKLNSNVDPELLLRRILSASTSNAVEEILATLPIRNEQEYTFNSDDNKQDWKQGMLHWFPVGGDRGNAGRIKLANRPINPIAERTINAMESLIEMMRRLELLNDSSAPPPGSPREAVRRYFRLPPLDQLQAIGTIDGHDARKYAREIARQIMVELMFDKKAREFATVIRDYGIGQAPAKIHRTLLSLGSSDKGDKPYLIGVFGQGGSSAYAASKYSTVVSRREMRLLDGEADGIGWTIVKHIFPKGRRDDYFAYLASHPDGRVPILPHSTADAVDFKHGTRFAHIDYDFGSGGAAITRNFFQMLNHVLFNPVLPFDTNVSGTVATIRGNGYRLSNLKTERKAVDKRFAGLTIEQ
jgi:hypothetical protein